MIWEVKHCRFTPKGEDGLPGEPMHLIIAPLLPLLACMMVVLLFVTYVPEVYMWLPRSFGLVK